MVHLSKTALIALVAGSIEGDVEYIHPDFIPLHKYVPARYQKSVNLGISHVGFGIAHDERPLEYWNQRNDVTCDFPLEVMIILDDTARMAKTIPGFFDNITDIFDVLETNHPGSRVGFITFQDKPLWPLGFSDDYWSEIHLPLGTYTKDEFLAFKGKFKATGGSDVPENQFGAIAQALYSENNQWTPLADSKYTRVIYLVTDSLVHHGDDGMEYTLNFTDAPHPSEYRDSRQEEFSIDFYYHTVDDMADAIIANQVYLATSVHDRNGWGEEASADWSSFNNVLQQSGDFIREMSRTGDEIGYNFKRILESIKQVECDGYVPEPSVVETTEPTVAETTEVVTTDLETTEPTVVETTEVVTTELEATEPTVVETTEVVTTELETTEPTVVETTDVGTTELETTDPTVAETTEVVTTEPTLVETIVVETTPLTAQASASTEMTIQGSGATTRTSVTFPIQPTIPVDVTTTVHVTTEPIVTIPVEDTETELLTTEPIVTIPVEDTETELLTTEPIVTIPVEATETELLTTEPIVTIPVEDTETEPLTTELIPITGDTTRTGVTFPIQPTIPVDVTATVHVNTEQIVTITVEATETELLTTEPIVTIPVEATETDLLTTEPIVTIPVEATETGLLTTEPIVTIPVEVTETELLTTEPIVTIPVDVTTTPGHCGPCEGVEPCDPCLPEVVIKMRHRPQEFQLVIRNDFNE